MRKRKIGVKATKSALRGLYGMPLKDWVECDHHGGQVDIAKLPDTIDLEGTSITMANSTYGCAECIAECIAEEEKRLAQAEEEKRREREQKRAEKKRIIEDARTSDESLKQAIESFRQMSDRPSPKELAKHRDDVEEAVRQAQKKRDLARKALMDAERKLDEQMEMLKDAEQIIASDQGDRKEACDMLKLATEANDEAWSKVPRIKRDKLRDKAVRRTARQMLKDA